MTFGERLRQKRESIGLSRADLAKQLGVTPSAIGNYETGVSSPRDEILYKIFEVLEVEPNFLFQDSFELKKEDLSSEETEHIKKYRALNEHGKKIVDIVLDEEYNDLMAHKRMKKAIEYMELCKYEMAASAGTGSYLQDECKTLIRVPANEITRRADFALPISGDSMEPEFHDGDTVLVKSMSNINIGEIGIFIINGDSYIKKLGEGRLISLNSKYNDIIFTEYDNITCVGKVIGTI